MTIRTKQFQLLTDAELAWELMTDVFTPDECNGPAAPFFEYALASSWQDKTYLRLNRFWLDGDKPVGFLFYEDDPNRLHFVLRPGYEALAGEMIDYGETAFPAFGEPRELVLNQGQKALIEAVEARGYKVVDREEYKVFDFRTGKLDHPLPTGYRFVDPGRVDPLKAARCMWEGFNEGRGPFTGWEIPGTGPHELYQSVLGASSAPSPHATYERNVVIADEAGDYVCFAGMWWVEKNKLAYLEPLCTVPGHRHKGLAAAALSQHDRLLRPLGARIMTGGVSDFYRRIGYRDAIMTLHFAKEPENALCDFDSPGTDLSRD